MKGLELANPEYLFLLLLLPFYVWWYFQKISKNLTTIKFPDISVIGQIEPTMRQRLIHLPFFIRLITLALIILIIGGPRSKTEKAIQKEGIDIVIALDLSTSMEAKDFDPSRIEAAKRTVEKFISSRINDRIGLVSFASVAITSCPLTLDHDALTAYLKELNTAMLPDGTAIGMGLATAINRIKESKNHSKVIILITDGVNNTGNISPQTAAEMATTLGVKVYTIGVGTMGKALFPVRTPFGIMEQYIDVRIDEELLKKISDETGGKYFRATDNSSLTNIYNEIDRLEKSPFESQYYISFHDEFLPFALIVGVLLILEIILRYWILRRLP